MKSLIIAAGRGKRIPKFTKKIPKCLIKISNKPIIARQIDTFRKNKIKTIAIVRGFKANKIKFKNIKYFNNLNFLRNDQLDSLFCAKKYFDDDTLVTFSDIIYDESVLKKIMKSKGSLVLGIEKKWKKRYYKRYDHPLSQADKVIINKNKITKIGKKISSKKASGEFLGMFKVSKKMWKPLFEHYEMIKKKQNTKKLQIHNFFNYILKYNIKLTPCFTKGRYMEIDTYNDYKIAREIFE
jgi:L-glutamine-phosphate cytidylyltransferase